MGENKHIEELDAFAKKYIKEIETEKPSMDFTSLVMSKIDTEVNAAVFKPKSLISKPMWFVIGLLITVAVVFSIQFDNTTTFDIPKVDFSIAEALQKINILSDISFSNSTFYIVLLFGIMLSAQLFYLKKYFDNRISN